MLEFFEVILNLHDDGAAAADGAESGESAEGANEAVDAEQQEDTVKEFGELIRGKYKNEYAAATQELINKRFAKSKEELSQLKGRLAEQDRVFGILHQRYGTDSIDGVLEALENDENYLEQRAYDLGMTREQAKMYDQMQRENAEFKKREEAQRKAEQEAQSQQEAESRKQETIGQWLKEADALKASYPDFDLETELKSDEFVRKLAKGNTVEDAYILTHHKELMQASTAYAAQQTEKKVTDNIRARGTRPQEVGASNKSSFTTAQDISKMSLDQIREYTKRAARGENITFR